jgi:histidinol dehydrogenase
MRIIELTEESRKNILEDLLKRSPNNYDKYQKSVNEILANVKKDGDKAVFSYTEKFDHAKIDASTLYVTEDEIKEAYSKVDSKLVEIMKKSIHNIRSFHEKQVRNSWFTTREDGVILGQRITALDSVGVYVPGGKAAYPSSVLMNIIPAQVAGVRRIVMATPPGADGKVNPATLTAAHLAGATEICKVGGAQAIAALAYGTESIPKVDKIAGPGNIFVALAKKTVYGHVSIDSVAGPSEIMILADETANPRYVAADLLSQAEHDELASAILVTTSRELAEQVSEQVSVFASELSRREIIGKSIENYGYILLADSMEEAIDTVNEIASEHLEILTANPFDTMTRVKNAGAIFLGEYSSEPLGDYFAGPNHVLPTNGTAKFFSPLSVDDFIKKSSVISYSREALEEVHEDIIAFAKAEHLTAHANSIAVRFGKEVLDEN